VANLGPLHHHLIVGLLRCHACMDSYKTGAAVARAEHRAMIHSTVKSIPHFATPCNSPGTSPFKHPSPSLWLLLAHVLIPEQRPLPAELVINDRLRVSQLLELVPRHVVKRVMYRLALQVFQFRNPVPDVVALRIALLRLGQGVEDPLMISVREEEGARTYEVWLRVRSGLDSQPLSNLSKTAGSH